jgi:hypothetical protein
MCGRFTLFLSPELLAAIYEAVSKPDSVRPSYNIAPTQSVLIVRQQSDGRRELSQARWGLFPSWSKDPAIGKSLINARSETVAEKPSFRSAFHHRRCIIPASGFFEWQKTSSKSKQPWHITSSDGGPLSFAGLWEHWQSTRVGMAPDGWYLRFEKPPVLSVGRMWRNESTVFIYRVIPKPRRCMGWSKIASMNSSEFTRNALPISTAFGDQSSARLGIVSWTAATCATDLPVWQAPTRYRGSYPFESDRSNCAKADLLNSQSQPIQF